MVPNPMEPGPTEFPVSRWNQYPFQEEFYFIFFFRFRIHALYWAYTVRTFFFPLGTNTRIKLTHSEMKGGWALITCTILLFWQHIYATFSLQFWVCFLFFFKKSHSYVTKMIFQSYCRNKKQGLNIESNKKDPQKASKNGRIWRAVVSHLYQLHVTLLQNIFTGANAHRRIMLGSFSLRWNNSHKLRMFSSSLLDGAFFTSNVTKSTSRHTREGGGMILLALSCLCILATDQSC